MSFSSETQHHYPLSFTNRHNNNPLLKNRRQHQSTQQLQHVCMDLQQVLAEYDTEPEMLKLILRCKIEEDKRHTAEARLKAKELDLMWVQSQLAARCQHNAAAAAASTHNDFSSALSKRTSSISSYEDDEDDHQRRRRDSAAAAMIAMGSTPSPCNYYPTSTTTTVTAYPSPSSDGCNSPMVEREPMER
ncbi:hypothetical protein O0I10_008423 [Lichtheimia ornata]|uniref:Uncharacterized protein n=1 Tax=Lichtheimia ornata TaxID=688661 RepID=A0AAD7UYG9_9FUNG|nr:uncharacterized protein O0I10_008423 [Lichtheimia ornata]KAJ8655983.1 hypothetical protein O0I10_008423 [Lichtheimia ornata]